MEDESFDVEEYPDYYENESASALGGLADDYDSDDDEEEEEEANVQENDDDEEEDKENANLQGGESGATKTKDDFYWRFVGLLEEQSLNCEQEARDAKLARVLSSGALATMPPAAKRATADLATRE